MSEHVDVEPEQDYYHDSSDDQAAEYAADQAAANGKWANFTQPGFEASATAMQVEAQDELDEGEGRISDKAEAEAQAHGERYDRMTDEEFLAEKEDETYADKPAQDAQAEANREADKAELYDDPGYDDGGYDLYREYEDEETEDPLAGDVDPTGGYYEEPLSPWDAHTDRVHKQHGN